MPRATGPGATPLNPDRSHDAYLHTAMLMGTVVTIQVVGARTGSTASPRKAGMRRARL